eukprot:514329_1
MKLRSGLVIGDSSKVAYEDGGQFSAPPSTSLTMLRMPASRISSLCGYVQYANVPEIISDLVYQGRMDLLLEDKNRGAVLVTEEEKLEEMVNVVKLADPTAGRELELIAAAARDPTELSTPRELKVMQDRINTAVSAIKGSEILSSASVELLESAVLRDAYMSHGTQAEETALDLFAAMSGSEVYARNGLKLSWAFSTRGGGWNSTSKATFRETSVEKFSAFANSVQRFLCKEVVQDALNGIINIVFQEAGGQKKQKNSTPPFDYSTQTRRRLPVELLAKRRKEILLVPFAQVERHCWDWGFGIVDQALLLKGLNTWQRTIVHNEAEAARLPHESCCLELDDGPAVGADKCCFAVAENITVIVWLQTSCHHDTAVLQLKHNKKNAAKDSSSSSDVPFFEIVGVVDGMVDELIMPARQHSAAAAAGDEWAQAIVEVKTRVFEPKRPPPLKDQIQLAAYLLMAGLEHGYLVQARGEKLLVDKVSLDSELYQHRLRFYDTILPRLYNVATLIHDLRTYSNRRMAFVLASDEERWTAITSWLPWVDKPLSKK